MEITHTQASCLGGRDEKEQRKDHDAQFSGLNIPLNYFT